MSKEYREKSYLDQNIITFEDMKLALMGAINMSNEDAEEYARFFTNFLGYGNSVLDNVLTQEDRDVFYMLENSGLVKGTREETMLLKGTTWRIFHWEFKINEIEKFKNKALGIDEIEDDENEFSCYENWDFVKHTKLDIEKLINDINTVKTVINVNLGTLIILLVYLTILKENIQNN